MEERNKITDTREKMPKRPYPNDAPIPEDTMAMVYAGPLMGAEAVDPKFIEEPGMGIGYGMDLNLNTFKVPSGSAPADNCKPKDGDIEGDETVCACGATVKRPSKFCPECGAFINWKKADN